jgi:hypothetical protein
VPFTNQEVPVLARHSILFLMALFGEACQDSSIVANCENPAVFVQEKDGSPDDPFSLGLTAIAGPGYWFEQGALLEAVVTGSWAGPVEVTLDGEIVSTVETTSSGDGYTAVTDLPDLEIGDFILSAVSEYEEADGSIAQCSDDLSEVDLHIVSQLDVVPVLGPTGDDYFAQNNLVYLPTSSCSVLADGEVIATVPIDHAELDGEPLADPTAFAQPEGSSHEYTIYCLGPGGEYTSASQDLSLCGPPVLTSLEASASVLTVGEEGDLEGTIESPCEETLVTVTPSVAADPEVFTASSGVPWHISLLPWTAAALLDGVLGVHVSVVGQESGQTVENEVEVEVVPLTSPYPGLQVASSHALASLDFSGATTYVALAENSAVEIRVLIKVEAGTNGRVFEYDGGESQFAFDVADDGFSIRVHITGRVGGDGALVSAVLSGEITPDIITELRLTIEPDSTEAAAALWVNGLRQVPTESRPIGLIIPATGPFTLGGVPYATVYGIAITPGRPSEEGVLTDIEALSDADAAVLTARYQTVGTHLGEGDEFTSADGVVLQVISPTIDIVE